MRLIVLLCIPVVMLLSGCGNAQKSQQSSKPAGTTDAKDSKKKKKKTNADDAKKLGSQTDKDKEWTAKLMADGGRWKYEGTNEDGSSYESTIFYLPAGVLNEKDEDGTSSGTWEVRDGYLIWQIDDLKTVDKIKEVTDKEFLYIDHETQQTVIERKIKD